MTTEIDHITALQAGMGTLYDIATLHTAATQDRVSAAEALARLALQWEDNLLLTQSNILIPIEPRFIDE
jgi:hypothetical protein